MIYPTAPAYGFATWVPGGVGVGVGVGVPVGVGVGVVVGVGVGVVVGVGVGVPGVGVGVPGVGVGVGGVDPLQTLPLTEKLVGAGLLPDHEALKPGLAVPLGAILPFQLALVTVTFWPD